jgi:hypothetical protein
MAMAVTVTWWGAYAQYEFFQQKKVQKGASVQQGGVHHNIKPKEIKIPSSHSPIKVHENYIFKPI